MTQAISTVQASEVLPSITKEKIIEFLGIIKTGTALNDKEKIQFIEVAMAYGLNPFKREIYATKYAEGDGFSIIVGFETYLKRAERSGKLDGWECEFLGEGDSLSCVVTIYRKDWSRPFKHEVFYSECVQKTKDGHITKFWQKKRLMTRKVGISQAFRMAFPDENGGLPYTNDEMGMEVQDTTHEVVNEQAQIQQPAQVYQATPVAPAQPEVKPLTKKENAELMQSLKIWHTSFGELEADNERNGQPVSWDVLAASLGAIANLPVTEKVVLFNQMKARAIECGVGYDGKERNYTKKFYDLADDYDTAEADDEGTGEENMDAELSKTLAHNE